MSAIDSETRKNLERMAIEAARFAGLTGDQATGLLALFEAVYTGARAAERSDVIAECERTERNIDSNTAHGIAAMRVRIQRAEHVRRGG